jgi:hypothetical protein
LDSALSCNSIRNGGSRFKFYSKGEVKAIVAIKHRPPDILQLKEVEKPAPKDNEVLVYATTVTSGDVRIQSSKYATWF